MKRVRGSTHLGPGLIAAIIGLSGCSGTPVSNTCNGNSVGGDGSTLCATGGTVSTGGEVSTGGVATGGEVSTGGVATGGEVSTGGAATGGEVSTGGAEATGGDVSTGGVATGGEVSTGGAATGGEVSTGGAEATGGDVSTGGAATGGEVSTGGAATGGDVSTGGAEATGGAPSTGGTTSVPPQAILQYKFDNSSATAAEDSTPNKNNGTLSSVSLSASGRNGNAATFAATDASITVPTGLLTGAHALTISAWVKLTASAPENHLFYFGTETTHLSLVLNNSGTPAGMSLRFKGPTGDEVALTSPTQLPTTGVWKHITVTISPEGAAMYVDGKIVAQDNTLVIDPSTLGSTTSNLVGSSPTAQAFQGAIDEFYMYNYVLPLKDASPDDIRTLARPQSDYSVYHLDEGTDTTTADSSDRHYDGALVGGATWVDGAFGKAVKLSNGAAPAQQYVQLTTGNVKNCTTTLTISAWINLTTNTTAAPFIEFAKDSTVYVNVNTWNTGSTYTGPVLAFNLVRPTANGLRQKSVVYTANSWTHVAVVRGWKNSTQTIDTTGYETTLYQNGTALVGATCNTSASITTVLGTPTFDYLGASYNPATPGFNGAIDEVQVSCRPYTADEIKQLAYKPN